MLVDFVNVGQGDCTILKIPSFGEDDFFAVVDAGPSQASATVVSELKSLGCDQVDVLVLSHPDADHTGGATDVMNSFKTVEAWDPGTSKDTATWRSTLETMAQKGVVRHNPAAGYVGMWGDAVVRVLGPQPGAATTAGDEVNNACLVLL
ncbi:MAG: MBL fold metallo-hydrolase, partial [Chloroflexi bacterium]|nr:MBL fold metallo-hydrolase [Chloroflexota bacterium]